MPKDDKGLGQAICDGNIQQVHDLLNNPDVSADCYCTSGGDATWYTLDAALLNYNTAPYKASKFWPITVELLEHHARLDANVGKHFVVSPRPVYSGFKYSHEFALVFLFCNPNSTKIAQEMSSGHMLSNKEQDCFNNVRQVLEQYGYDFASLPSTMERLTVVLEPKKENNEESKQEPVELFNDIKALGAAGLKLFEKADVIAKDVSALNEDGGYRTIPNYVIDYFALRLLRKAARCLESFLKDQPREAGHQLYNQTLLQAILKIVDRNKNTHIPLPTEKDLKHYNNELYSTTQQLVNTKRIITITQVSNDTEQKANADTASVASLIRRRPGYLLPENKKENHNEEIHISPPGGLRV